MALFYGSDGRAAAGDASEILGGQGMAIGGGLGPPVTGLGIVLWCASAIRIHHAEHGLSGDEAKFGGLAGFAEGNGWLMGDTAFAVSGGGGGKVMLVDAQVIASE